MGRFHHNHQRLHVQPRQPDPSPSPESSQMAKFLDATMLRLSNFSKRGATGSDDSDSNTCTKGDTSNQCAKPSESNNITLPVLLGVLYVSYNA